MANRTKKARYIGVPIPLRKDQITVYASSRIAEAFQQVAMDMTLFKAVKLSQLLEAVYLQGKKDGARSAFETVDTHFEQAKKMIPHKNPGRPRGK